MEIIIATTLPLVRPVTAAVIYPRAEAQSPRGPPGVAREQIVRRVVVAAAGAAEEEDSKQKKEESRLFSVYRISVRHIPCAVIFTILFCGLIIIIHMHVIRLVT